jgi:excisionase family DNA binding protein
MERVNIDTLKPEMVLAEDLFHADGRLLLSKGLKLESNHLRVLKIWGIAASEIEEVSDGSRSPTLEEIDRVIRDPRSSAIHVADVISKDPNLTTKLLKVVNSAFYGFSSTIDTISRAVAILGRKAAEYLSVDVRTIYRLVKKGMIPGRKVGGGWKFKRETLDQCLSWGEKPLQTERK